MKTKRITQLWFITLAAIAALALSVPAPAQAAYESSLISYWKLDDNAGNATVDNSIGSDGTASRNTSLLQTTGKIGGAINLNGSSDIVTASGPNLNGDASFTLSFWAKPDQYKNDSGLICFGANGVTYGTIFVSMYSTALDGKNIAAGHYANDHLYAQQFVLNQWQLITIAYNKATSTESLYYNGQFSESWSPHDLALNSSHQMMFGRWVWASNPTNYFDGSLDDIAIWNRTLTASEIDAIYDMGVQRVYDLSGSGGDLATAVAKQTALVNASLGLTDIQLNQLVDVYTSQNATGTLIGSTTWFYIAHNDPIWNGHQNVGEKFTGWDGKTYIYLGGGVGQGEGGESVPEPATVVGLVIAGLGIVARRRLLRPRSGLAMTRSKDA